MSDDASPPAPGEAGNSAGAGVEHALMRLPTRTLQLSAVEAALLDQILAVHSAATPPPAGGGDDGAEGEPAAAPAFVLLTLQRKIRQLLLDPGAPASWSVPGAGDATPLPRRITADLQRRTVAIEKLLERFLETLLSPQTRTAYAGDLRMWLNWLAAHGVDPLVANRAVGKLWRAELGRSAARSPATIRRRLSAVASFYDFLVDAELFTGTNPTKLREVDKPKITTERAQLYLSPADVTALTAAADRYSPRASLLITLLYLTGVRISEALAINREDILYDRGHRLLRVRAGKGGKARSQALPPQVLARLERYDISLGIEPTALVVAGEPGAGRPLLVTRTGRRLTRSTAAREIQAVARSAGPPLAELAPLLSPHDERAAYASHNFDIGTALPDIQAGLGHADPRTTLGYDRRPYDPNRAPGYRIVNNIAPLSA